MSQGGEGDAGREGRREGGKLGREESEWACREVHFQLPSANEGLSQGTHVDEALLKPSS